MFVNAVKLLVEAVGRGTRAGGVSEALVRWE